MHFCDNATAVTTGILPLHLGGSSGVRGSAPGGSANEVTSSLIELDSSKLRGLRIIVLQTTRKMVGWRRVLSEAVGQ
jgi:hypothetical protein